jgi:glycosyltransferase involved in cell wall biosynthesis
MTRVAVVIPCFDDGATLGEAVDSVLEQEEECELVVVDDGSRDPDTEAVFDSLERRGTKVLHQANQGLSAARMAGVRATAAPFVLALDADDRLRPGALRALADGLTQNADVALVWGDYRTFGDRSYVQRTADSLDPWQLTYQNDLPVVVMVRREALLDSGGWELCGGYEDWDLWLGLAERGQAGARLPIVAFDYRLHGQRMLRESARRHGELYARLRERHADLYARRRELWRRSRAPFFLRLALPAIEGLPLSRNAKRQAGGVACHVANRRGMRTLWRRLRPT